jgi:hypothetical protein
MAGTARYREREEDEMKGRAGGTGSNLGWTSTETVTQKEESNLKSNFP